jgi:hypothetical protein
VSILDVLFVSGSSDTLLDDGFHFGIGSAAATVAADFVVVVVFFFFIVVVVVVISIKVLTHINKGIPNLVLIHGEGVVCVWSGGGFEL